MMQSSLAHEHEVACWIEVQMVTDLTSKNEIPITLLAQPYEWRVRAVEQIEVLSAQACLRRRSLQVLPLRTLMTGLIPTADERARIVLPVASMPKGPVNRFDIEVDGGPAHMIPRVAIADIEAAYLEHLSHEAGLELVPVVRSVLPFLLGFTTGPWEQWLRDFDDDPADALMPYLKDGLGQDVSTSRIQIWQDALGDVSSILVDRTDGESTDLSAVVNPLLALPSLLEGTLPSLDAVQDALASYGDFVRAAAATSAAFTEPVAADDLLISLAEYGLYWDLMVTAVVPLDAPFTVKTTERRPLGLDVYRQRAQQALLLADAVTNHVTLTVSDNNVEIVGPKVQSTTGDDLSFLAAARDTDPEGASFYLSDWDREYRGVLDFGLRPTLLVQVVSWLFVGLVAGPLIALIVVRPVTTAALAVLVVPSTFAASLLLVREDTTLGTSLRSRSTWALVVALTVLWLIVIALDVSNHVRQ
jgi:hypothetical protein